MTNQWLDSSDLVGKFAALKIAQLKSDKVLSPDPPMDAIKTRLAKLSLTWDDLDKIEKLALVWDMGLVWANERDTKDYSQVYTPCIRGSDSGEPMSNITLSEKEFKGTETEATVIDCLDIDGDTYSRQNYSDGRFVIPKTKCAISDRSPMVDSHSSMWTQDGSGLNAFPVPIIYRHLYDSNGTHWMLFAIHTQLTEKEPSWGSCPEANDELAGLTIPCRVFDVNKIPEGWCLPSPSAQMNTWLAQIHYNKKEETSIKSSGSTLSSGSIAGIALGAMVIVVFCLYLFWLRRKKQSSDFYTNYFSLASDGGGTITTATMATTRYDYTKTRRWQPIHTASKALNDFQRDSVLNEKRVPYSSIDRTRQLSKGAFGEVWLGSLEGQPVAVKRLLESKRASEVEIEKFAQEIRLMATFSHPNVVNFIAFAWDNLQNLCAVIEYMPNGDLMSFLTKNAQLTWNAKEKTKIAIGVANALAYLHGHNPKIIHRDLKSKNVLMGENCIAKLTDFGISRENQDETMTEGVGTVYWTAPEVLVGSHYTEKADIYSFGCLLIELDTHNSPFAECKGIPQALMIQRITNEGLRPSVSDGCPLWLRLVVARCFERDPSLRPSAIELSDYLCEQE